ncbi:unnamed protein product, partial [Darwinula stevensoni]
KERELNPDGVQPTITTPYALGNAKFQSTSVSLLTVLRTVRKMGSTTPAKEMPHDRADILDAYGSMEHVGLLNILNKLAEVHLPRHIGIIFQKSEAKVARYGAVAKESIPRREVLEFVKDLVTKQFYTSLKEGLARYNLILTQVKTFSNVEGIGNHADCFRVCGSLIDACTLDATPDFGNYHSSHLIYTMSIQHGGKSGEFFERRLLFYATLKFNMLQVISNGKLPWSVYHSLLLLAYKAHALSQALSIHNYLFIKGVIRRFPSEKEIPPDGTCPLVVPFSLRKSSILFLAYDAFFRMMKRRPGAYSDKLLEDIRHMKSGLLNKRRLELLHAARCSKRRDCPLYKIKF